MHDETIDIRTPGIHHITAIAGDPQKNLDFYAELLGLRLVKTTVNFDDPTTYHLYYGDGSGTPGTILTFFPWPRANRGRQGTGQAAPFAFAIRPASLGYWIERLVRHGVKYQGPTKRFGQQVLSFQDPDGLQVELIAHRPAETWEPIPSGLVPKDHEVRGFHSVTLWEEGYEQTAQLLTGELGFRAAGEENNVFRFISMTGSGSSSNGSDAKGSEAGQAGYPGTPGTPDTPVTPGAIVDVRCAPGFWRGVVAVGSIHHVAFRTRDDVTQRALREQLVKRGLNVTPVIDRQYFRSVYFREPGGVLFETATETPGFAVDEPADELGTHLKLPPWLEVSRDEIESVLPPLRRPQPQPQPQPQPRSGAEGGIEPEVHIEVGDPSI